MSFSSPHDNLSMNNNMVREKFIANVPNSIIESAHFPSQPWQRTFNIASWIRFRSPRPNHVALILHFTDEEGIKSAEIDQYTTQLETTLLLANHVTISGKGKVKNMNLYLRVNDNSAPYVIDELYVQNCEKNAVAQPKIISAA